MDEIGEQRFDAALLQVLESSPYRPDIADIRRAAGLRPSMDAPDEEALTALTRIVALMRRFGPRLEPLPGKVLAEFDADGLVLVRPTMALPEPPPALGARVEAAIVELGLESREAGLGLIAVHPALSGNSGQSGEPQLVLYTLKAWAEIERRWCAAYARAANGGATIYSTRE